MEKNGNVNEYSSLSMEAERPKTTNKKLGVVALAMLTFYSGNVYRQNISMIKQITNDFCYF